MIETVTVAIAVVVVVLYLIVVAGARHPLLRQWSAWVGFVCVLAAVVTGARLVGLAGGRPDIGDLIAFGINVGLALLLLRQGWLHSRPYEERKRRGLFRMKGR